jgi:hypothetical protein
MPKIVPNRISIALFLLVPVHCATAVDFPAFDAHLAEARTLDALPKEVTQLLGRGKPGNEGIANVREPFNRTDVVDTRLPMRRFIVGGSDLRFVLVAYEQGGRAYGIFAKAFSLDAAGWREVGSWTLSHNPYTLWGLVDEVDPEANDTKTVIGRSVRETLRRQSRVLGTRPVRPQGKLRDQNLSDDEIREIQAIGLRELPGAVDVNISGVTAGCPCEEGDECSDQVWIVAYRPGESLGLLLSRMEDRWKIGPLQQWWLDYDKLTARRERLSNTSFDLEQTWLFDRFPMCPDQPASKKAVATAPGR